MNPFMYLKLSQTIFGDSVNNYTTSHRHGVRTIFILMLHNFPRQIVSLPE